MPTFGDARSPLRRRDELDLQLDWNSSSDSNENMTHKSCEVLTTIEDDEFCDDISEAILSREIKIARK